MFSPPYVDVTLLKNQAIEASGTIATEPAEVYRYNAKTIYIESTVNVNVEVKLGCDKDHMAFLKTGTRNDTEDGDRIWSCDAATAGQDPICFEIIEHAVYLQLVITNQDGTAGTVSAWMSGK